MPTIAKRVVFDTNVLISAALQPKGPSRSGIEAVAFSGGVILFSQATFDELLTRLNRPRFDAYISREIREVYIRQIEAVSQWIPITGARLGCRDPDDDKVLETALSGGADCLVTGDKDLLVLSKFAGVPILTPSQFLAW